MPSVIMQDDSKASQVSNVSQDVQRVDRVTGFLSSLLNWVRPPPHPLANVSPLWLRRRAHSLTGEGVGGPNSDEGSDTVLF
jgi:hypothetical protein